MRKVIYAGWKKATKKEIKELKKVYDFVNSKNIKVTRKELTEIYNALGCLNIEIRDKQKRRTKFVQELIKKISNFKDEWDRQISKENKTLNKLIK